MNLGTHEAATANTKKEHAHETAGNHLFDGLRHLVSREKKRFTIGGYDLDLTYITDRVIAMGFPAENIEGMYRNPMAQVQQFFNENHPNHYKIYNLCIERSYDASKFNGFVEVFPFRDHNAPPLKLIGEFCKSVDAWLVADSKHVVAIHCKAGKGRTGLLICCWLLHAGICKTAKDAIDFFAAARTDDNSGVTIPSQIRYIEYYEKILQNGFPSTMPTYKVIQCKLAPIPQFDVGGGCDPWFKIETPLKQQLFKSKVFHAHNSDHLEVIMDIEGCKIQGDVKFCFLDKDLTLSDKMFQFYLNTAFITDENILLMKEDLDSACKDKHNEHFDPRFAIILQLQKVTE